MGDGELQDDDELFEGISITISAAGHNTQVSHKQHQRKCEGKEILEILQERELPSLDVTLMSGGHPWHRILKILCHLLQHHQVVVLSNFCFLAVPVFFNYKHVLIRMVINGAPHFLR